MTRLLCNSGVLGSWLSYIAGEDVERTRITSIESVLKRGGPRGKVRFAYKDRDEL